MYVELDTNLLLTNFDDMVAEYEIVDRIEAINQIRQVLLQLDRHLDPVQTMLQRCLVDFSTTAEARDLASLRGLQERTGWIEHRIDGQLERARILSEQDHIRAMDEMSGSMYRLSWIATIFLPLTFITGLLAFPFGKATLDALRVNDPPTRGLALAGAAHGGPLVLVGALF